MNIKLFRFFLKGWIVLASLAAFVGGWVMLGHSGKPVAAQPQELPASQLAPLPTLAPLPSLNSSNTNNSNLGLQSLPQQPTASFRPRLRTRGS